MQGSNDTYEIYQAPSPTGSQMIRELQAGNADLTAYPLTLTADRLSSIDSTFSFYDGGISILTKPDVVTQTWYFFLQPFAWKLWGTILGSIFFIGIIMTLVIRIARGHILPRPGAPESIGYSSFIACVSMAHHPHTYEHTGWSYKLFSVGYLFFCLILIHSYGANLTAYLTITNLETPITSLTDIKRSGLKFGIQGGGTTETYFTTSTDPAVQSLIPYMVKYATYPDGVNDVQNDKIAAMIGDQPTLLYLSRTTLPCDVQLVGSAFGPGELVMGLQKGSMALQKMLNKRILELNENGYLEELKTEWFADKTICPAVPEEGGTEQGSVTKLTLLNFEGLFYFMLIWCLLGLILALVEYFLRRYGAKVQKRISFMGNNVITNPVVEEGRSSDTSADFAASLHCEK